MRIPCIRKIGNIMEMLRDNCNGISNRTWTLYCEGLLYPKQDEERYLFHGSPPPPPPHNDPTPPKSMLLINVANTPLLAYQRLGALPLLWEMEER